MNRYLKNVQVLMEYLQKNDIWYDDLEINSYFGKNSENIEITFIFNKHHVEIYNERFAISNDNQVLKEYEYVNMIEITNMLDNEFKEKKENLL